MQLLLTQTGTGNVLCVSHIIFLCVVFLFYCVVRSDNGLFIFGNKGGLYSHIELKKKKKGREAAKYFFVSCQFASETIDLKCLDKAKLFL